MVVLYCDRCKKPIDTAGKNMYDFQVNVNGYDNKSYAFELCRECYRKLLDYAEGKETEGK